jgi:ligand-binding sensor domain-containing protein/signal transduction histidine kinase
MHLKRIPHKPGAETSLGAAGTSARATILVLAVVCFFTHANAAYALDTSKTLTQYTHRVWNQEEGLLEPTVYSILQTHDGYLWLGTQNGLIRFDGERFRPVKVNRASGGDFEPALMRSLFEDKDHVLWAGSIGNGLARIARGSRRWFTTRDGLPTDIAGCVVPENGGGLWVCTSRGLVDFHNKVQRIYTRADGLPSDRVHSVCEARDGAVWVATFDAGLSRRVGGRFIPFTPLNKSIGQVYALSCARDGSIWAGTEEGIVRINGSNIRRYTARDGLPDDSISTVIEGPDGSVWVGTQTGIARFSNNEWSAYRTRDGLSHTGVLSMLLDREGSLWVGTKNGLDQFTDSKVTPYTTSEGMPANDTGPVIEDKDGTLWVGTRENGLAKFDGHRFTVLTKSGGLADNHILSLAAGPDGDLWIGTPKGLNRLRHGRVIRTYTEKDGLSGDRISSLFVDSQSALWAGGNRGLSVLENNRFSRQAQFPSLDADPIVALGGGRTTRLFVSTASGRLYTLRNGAVSTYMPPDPTRAIASYYADTNRHVLWMGTLGSGLVRWKNGALIHVRTKDGLFDDQIYAILPDDHANFWFASSKGIFRVSASELDEFADGKRKGVTSLPFSTGQLRFECQGGVQPAAYRTRDGRLWFSTTNGLVVVDPNHLLPNRLPPPAQIETVFVNGQRHDPEAPLSLAPYEKNLEIRYAGLSFVTPEKVTFRYILDGYDKEWVQAGSRREAFYTNLPPGHFRFRVIASSSDGVWSTNGGSIDFTIQPLLYQRPWFFPILALLLGLAIWLGYRIRIRNLKQQFRLVISERSRIARELHDTLLQGLSGITMQLQALWTRLPASHEKEVLRDILKDAGTCLSDARRSLLGLRSPANIEEDGLAENLARNARQAVSGTPIRLALEIQPAPCRLSPDLEYQLLRIAQEAVANSVRHAEPKTIEIRLAFRKDNAELLIKDDGKGFDTNVRHSQPGHYGLVGMHERANELGAKLIVTSMPGFGAEILVTAPIGTKWRPGAEGHDAPEQHETMEKQKA